MEVTIQELPPERWLEAGAMAGRAFWTEEYMRVLAADPIARAGPQAMTSEPAYKYQGAVCAPASCGAG